MVDRNEDREKWWRRSEKENEWGDDPRGGRSYNRGNSRQMDDENLGGFAWERGRSFNRRWDDEERWDRTERGEWDYEGPYYNRGSFNPGWEMDRDYGQDEPRDYSHGRDFSSGRGYSYGREFDRNVGRDYSQGRFNRYRGGYYAPLNRGESGRDANLKSNDQRLNSQRYGRDWEIEDEWDEDTEPAVTVYEEWWLVPGPFTGVGPRGYQRADDRIFEDVCERLTQHGQIDATEIDVEVKDGEVWLRGTVDNRRTKRMAEDIIDDIPGVNDIHNQLRVGQGEYRMIDQGREGRQQMQRSQAAEDRQGEGINLGQGSRGGAAPERGISPGRIREGMEVVGADGERVGMVKEVRSMDFLVDRPMARDVYIPFTAVLRTNGEVMLHIRAGQVSDQNWPAPPLFGSGGEGQEGINS